MRERERESQRQRQREISLRGTQPDGFRNRTDEVIKRFDTFI